MREGWVYKKLGEVCSINSGKSIKSNLISTDIFEGGFPCYGGNGLRGYVPCNSHEGGLPVIGRVGALCGNVHYVQQPFYATEHALVVSKISEDVDHVWLCRLLESMKLGDYAEGVAQPVIAASKIAKLCISIPPLSTQQQIVSELDLLSHIIDQKRQQLKEYDALAESIFYDMFGDPKTSIWNKSPLKDLSIKIGDGLHGTPIYDENGEYFFVNGNNLRDGIIVVDKQTKRVSQSEYTKYKIDFDQRTILVSINGTIGNKAFYNKEQIVLGKSACYIQLKENINMHYVYFLLVTPYFFEYVGNEETGSTIKNVSLKSMRSMPIPLPPIELQNSFAAKIESIELQKQLLRASIKETEMLFQSRMDYWFNG